MMTTLVSIGRFFLGKVWRRPWCAAVALGFLMAVGPVIVPAESAVESREPQVIGREGDARLLLLKGQRVLLVKGEPYQMGFQHGKLLAKEVAEDARAYLHEWCVAKAGVAISEIEKIFDSLRPFIPKDYVEEMKGLADGAGVSLREIYLLHSIPERFHCTGAAAFSKATADGKLYHTRSLDYSLEIGDAKSVQENAIVIVYQPNAGNVHVVVSWAGLIGCVSGMNAKGISIGEMGNACRDESYAGMPMIFMLREALRTCNTLEEVVAFIRKAPRTCGFTFIVGDAKIPSACALEVSHSRMAVGLPGDEKSDSPPHFPIPYVVRRGNHFVDKKMAAIQRDVYDPEISSPATWLAYSIMSSFLQENYGRVNDIKMIELLRKYPPEHSCFHQAVFCPSTLDFWVSNAVSPSRARYAGAQNQPFYKYSLLKLVEGTPFEPEVNEPAPRRPEKLPPHETGTLSVSEKEEFLSDGPLSRFRLKREDLRWVLSYDSATENYLVADLTFPSEIQTRWPEANTVFGEYYVPKVTGKVPAAIVLDVLSGDFVVARTVARSLADKGIAALALHMPFFGRRRPKDDGSAGMFSGDVSFAREAMTQAVIDIRSAALWLRTRKEVDADKTGIVGVSLGAVIGALCIGVDNSFSKSALVLGGGDIAQIIWSAAETEQLRAELLKKGYTLERLREELSAVDPLTYAERINPRTVVMFNGKKDQTVTGDCTVKLWEKAGRPRIVWYDTSHLGIVIYANKIIEETVNFIRDGEVRSR